MAKIHVQLTREDTKRPATMSSNQSVYIDVTHKNNYIGQIVVDDCEDDGVVITYYKDRNMQTPVQCL